MTIRSIPQTELAHLPCKEHSSSIIHSTLNCIGFCTLSVCGRSPFRTRANFKLLVLLISWENGECFGKAGEVEEGRGDASIGPVSPVLSPCWEQPHVIGQGGSGSGMCLQELEQTWIWVYKYLLDSDPCVRRRIEH